MIETYLYMQISITRSGLDTWRFQTGDRKFDHGELHSDGGNGCTVPLDPNVALPKQIRYYITSTYFAFDNALRVTVYTDASSDIDKLFPLPWELPIFDK